MSYFGKIQFGEDSNFEDASRLVKALHDNGYVTSQDPESGEVYFSDGG